MGGLWPSGSLPPMIYLSHSPVLPYFLIPFTLFQNSLKENFPLHLLLELLPSFSFLFFFFQFSLHLHIVLFHAVLGSKHPNSSHFVRSNLRPNSSMKPFLNFLAYTWLFSFGLSTSHLEDLFYTQFNPL